MIRARRRPGSRLALCALLLSLALQCRAGGEAPPAAAVTEGGSQDVAWTRLRYEANKLGVSLSTRLDLVASSRREMLAPPYAGLGNGGFQSTSGAILRLDIHAHAESALDHYNAQGQIWFVPEDIAVLQRERLKPGPGGSLRVYRYSREGAVRIRAEPANREEGRLPPAAWTRIKRNSYPYDLRAAGCGFVTSPELLLFLASSHDAANGRPHCVFVDDALYRVWLVPGGEEQRPVDYAIQEGGVMHEVDGNRRLLKLSLRIEPISPTADPEVFELLELRGAIAIYVDAASRLPVLITGERAGVSDLGVRLVEADLRK